MPALVAHYQFALRVFSKLKKAGIDVADIDSALVGAQGPDIFFFHRVLPWNIGKSETKFGSQLHRMSPACLFEAFRTVINAEKLQRNEMLGYVEGFFCHYALDRATHPYILWAQEQLRLADPGYGTNTHQYHYRIESALDTLTLRRETGRLISDFRLEKVLPKDHDNRYLAIGRLYQPIAARYFGVTSTAEQLGFAPGDMRQALILMTDRSMLRQKLVFRPLETVARRGHFVTSLLRPVDTTDWDYANEGHVLWVNPYDDRQISSDSFFELFDQAANEAADMITEFLEALPKGKSMLDITQDRGFSSDLPGVYEGKRQA